MNFITSMIKTAYKKERLSVKAAGEKAKMSLFSIFSIIAVMIIVAAAFNMLKLAENMYRDMLGLRQNSEKSASSKKAPVDRHRMPVRRPSLMRRLSLWGKQLQYAAEISKNERLAREILNKYAAAQKIFYEHYGFYADSAADLIIQDNGHVTVIDGDLSVLNAAHSMDVAVNGYYFIYGSNDNQEKEKRKSSFSLCAVPDVYRFSGVNTYYIDDSSSLLQVDNRGDSIFSLKDADTLSKAQ